jgi:hypothetical protein
MAQSSRGVTRLCRYFAWWTTDLPLCFRNDVSWAALAINHLILTNW